MFSSFLFAADIISTVEFNHTGELLATGDKGGRVVIFQQEIEVWLKGYFFFFVLCCVSANKNFPKGRQIEIIPM